MADERGKYHMLSPELQKLKRRGPVRHKKRRVNVVTEPVFEDEEDLEWVQTPVKHEPEPIFTTKGKVWAVIIIILFLYFRFGGGAA